MTTQPDGYNNETDVEYVSQDRVDRFSNGGPVERDEQPSKRGDLVTQSEIFISAASDDR